MSAPPSSTVTPASSSTVSVNVSCPGVPLPAAAMIALVWLTFSVVTDFAFRSLQVSVGLEAHIRKQI
jgi:hypothetical protein